MIKLHKNYFLQALLFVLAVVGMNSCSCNSKDTIEDKLNYLVPDNADIILTGDISRAMSALEISAEDGKIVLPEYFLDFVSTTVDRRAAREIEENTDYIKGIDFTNAIMAMRLADRRPDVVAAFNITDEDEFYNALTDINEDFEIEESGDYKVITYDERAAFLIKDGLATVFFEEGEPLEVDDAVEALDKWIAKVEESPLADWKKTYLTQPAIFGAWYNIGTLSDLEPKAKREFQNLLDAQNIDLKLADLSCGLRFDLAGPSAKANFTLFEKDGEIVKNPCAGTFDTALLDYATPTDYVAASVAFSDKGMKNFINAYKSIINQQINERRQSPYYDSWDEQYISELQGISEIVTNIAESFDGNAMVAMGTASDATLSGSDLLDPNTYHFVAAVKCKPGKAREIYNMMCMGIDAACAQSAETTDSAMVAPTAEVAPAVVPAAKDYADSYNNRIRFENGYDSNYNSTYSYIDLYAKIEGNTIIFSNASISRKGGSNFDRNIFGSNAIALQVNLDKDSPLLKAFDLPCGINATITATDTFDMDITFSGTSQNFVPAIFKIISGLN